jgi:hypothetical protein
VGKISILANINDSWCNIRSVARVIPLRGWNVFDYHGQFYEKYYLAAYDKLILELALKQQICYSFYQSLKIETEEEVLCKDCPNIP